VLDKEDEDGIRVVVVISSLKQFEELSILGYVADLGVQSRTSYDLFHQDF